MSSTRAETPVLESGRPGGGLEPPAGAAQPDAAGLNSEALAAINRHRRAVQDLEDSERYSRAIFHAAEAGLIIIDLSTNQIMDANRCATEALGTDADDFIGERADYLGVDALCQDLRAGAAAAARREMHLQRRDGSFLPVLGSALPLTMSGQSLAVISFVDVSDVLAAKADLSEANQQLVGALAQVRAQRDAIVQSEKMASIGQLAAGVAHEINNPIGYVSSNLGTIAEYVSFMRSLIGLYGRIVPLEPSSAERAGLLAELETLMRNEDLDFVMSDIDAVLRESAEGTARVADIVQNLKSFARDDSMKMRACNLNEGVEAMIRMVWNELKYSCTVEKRLQPIPDVVCHAGRINQVIMNMLVNAAHAIGPDGGTITVATELRGEEVVVSIADTGCGMSPEIMSHIFDPFFTTKDVGKGTGLGLSIGHGIIADHGGRIEVESVVGTGSTFRIFLPLAAPTDEEMIG